MNTPENNVYETEAALTIERDRLRTFDVPTTASISAIGQLEPGQVLLDIGAGNNLGLMEYSEVQGADYLAMDINAGSQQEKISLGSVALQADARKLPIRPESVDVAHARFVLGHFTKPDDREQAMKQAFTSVKPGGKAVFIDYDWTVMEGSEAVRNLRDLTLNHVAIFDAAYGRSSTQETTKLLADAESVEVKTFSNEGLTDYSPLTSIRQITLMGLDRSGANDATIEKANNIFDRLESEAAEAPKYRMPDMVATIARKAL